VKNAEHRGHARRQDGARPEERGSAPNPTDIRPQETAAHPIDLGIVHAVAKQQSDGFAVANAANGEGETNAANESQPTIEANAMVPLPDRPAIDGREALPTNGAPDAVSPGEEPTSHRMRGRSLAIGHWRSGRYHWAYHRLTGVARAFPFVWYVTR
jgi:hypothetical protein